jgi:hypothetical protein
MRLAQTRERCVDLTGWKLEQSFSYDLQSKADGREHRTRSTGVALELELHLSCLGRFADQSQDKQGQRTDQQQNGKTLPLRGATGGESQSEALVFQVSEGFLDLHALRVKGGQRLGAQVGTQALGTRTENRKVGSGLHNCINYPCNALGHRCLSSAPTSP